MIELIVNPVSGGGRARRARAAIERELNARSIPYHVSETAERGHATALTREALQRGADSVAVLGGDGLLSEVCAALNGSGAQLLFVPCGTGNDFIKSLHLPKNPLAALRLQLDSPVRTIDCGLMNGTPFINVAGAGLDTDVLVHAEKFKARMGGLLPYLLGLFQALGKSRPFDAEITIDGVTEHRRYTIVSIANGRFIGGGMQVAPSASVTDGAFDVMLVDAMPVWKLALLVPLFLPGLHTRLSVTRRIVAREVMIKCTHPFTVDVDGELRPVTRAHFQVQPGGLRVRCP